MGVKLGLFEKMTLRRIGKINREVGEN